ARHDPGVLRRLGEFQVDSTQRLAELSAQRPDDPPIRALDQVMAGLSTQLAERVRACGPACAPIPRAPGAGGSSPAPGGPGAGSPVEVPTTAPAPEVGAGVGGGSAGSVGAGAGGGGASVGASLPGGGGATVVVGPTPSVSACVPVPLVN